MFASKPHFLDADPAFLSNVTGLSPDRERHDSYLDVEPVGGWVVGVGRCGKCVCVCVRVCVCVLCVVPLTHDR